jgi:hypothetical protein
LLWPIEPWQQLLYADGASLHIEEKKSIQLTGNKAKHILSPKFQFEILNQ